VIHRPSGELAADVLTKPPATERFNFLRDALLGSVSCACSRSVLQTPHARDMRRTRDLAITSEQRTKQARVPHTVPRELSPPATCGDEPTEEGLD